MAVQLELMDYRAQYLKELEDNCLSYWLKYGIDKVHGGLYSFFQRIGSYIVQTKVYGLIREPCGCFRIFAASMDIKRNGKLQRIPVKHFWKNTALIRKMAECIIA